MDRKEFLKTTGLAGGTLLFARYPELSPTDKKIRIGMITDLHHDIMHDGIERLSAFIKEMNADHPTLSFKEAIFAYLRKPMLHCWMFGINLKAISFMLLVIMTMMVDIHAIRWLNSGKQDQNIIRLTKMAFISWY